MTEAFKPIAVRRSSDNPALFWAHCRLDLQLLTIYEFLHRPSLASKGKHPRCWGRRSPWRDLMPSSVEHIGVDIDPSPAFGMRRHSGMQYYDGLHLTFADSSFAVILYTEVLEEVREPGSFLTGQNRLLRRGETLILTASWSARVHHLPYDFGLFSRFSLEENLHAANFSEVETSEHGCDIAVITNKLTVLTVRLLRPSRKSFAILTWFGALVRFPPSLYYAWA